jgi:dTDP-4-dehydrorhamnose reductase
MRTKVLVTGATGQLGQTIQQLFGLQEGDVVFTHVSKKELDITNKAQVDSFFNQHKFNYCINCAAYTNVEQAEKTPESSYKVNAEGVKHLAEGCLKSKTTLIHISTDYVFDGEKNEPYTEEDLPNPINEYGKSKLLGEQYIQEVLSDYFIIRTSWLYSKEFGHNFYKTIINKIKDKQELKIITFQKGTPTNCVELSKFIVALIKTQQHSFGTYHFSAFGEATWFDFALEIAKHYKYNSIYPIKPLKEHEQKTKRPLNSVLSNHKSKRIYPLIKHWKDTLNETLKGS